MKFLTFVFLVLSAILVLSASNAAQGPTCVDSLPKTNNCYKLYQPQGEAKGLVVLLPGFGDTIEFYDQYELPKLMARRGYLVAAISMAGYLEWEKDVGTLHALISEIVKKHRVPPGSLTIGGFSAGGVGAVRYAEFCVENKCDDTTRAAAVFSVDAPLDIERWYNCAVRKTTRRPAEESEWKFIRSLLPGILGGTPAEKRAEYVRAAPLTASEPNGGNARLLKDIPVRAYTEPDIVWTIDNRENDYYCHNAIDQAALILELKVQGNKNAELITTTGKGYRAEFIRETGKYRKGERSTHSWLIVDERNLADWIERHTRNTASQK